MSAKDRATLISKLFKVAKKHFKEIKPPSGRSLLEHVIYACCLEDSLYVAADEAFARLQEDYFDWNEVRVTTANELAEICKNLAQPEVAAVRIKKALHGIFETYYDFNIDNLKKDNLGKTVSQFQEFRGVSPFVISYMAQHGLGGHSIPVDKALLHVMYIIGAISEAEMGKGKVPGLERAIPKSKGTEFASVAHQLAAQFHKSQFDKETREILISIDASAKDRFPKRGGSKKETVEKKVAKKSPKKKTAEKAEPKTAEKKTTKKATKKKTTKKKVTKAAPKKKAASKTTVKKKAAKKKTTKKKVTKKKTAAKKTTTKKKATKKKSATKRLSKKKPR